MATKSFYTLEEAAKRLGMTEAEVHAIADTGKLTRVQHEGVMKFRVEHVELLADARESASGGLGLLDDSTAGGPIGLADSTAGGMQPPPPAKSSAKPTPSLLDDSVLGLADSTPSGAKPPADSSEQTGISALGGRGKGGDALEIGLETVGSGSGLLDLTRESEETALGAELIDQVYSGEGEPAAGASGLFEAVNSDSGLGSAPTAVPVGMTLAEPYDGAWSGAGLGLLIAAFAGLVVAALIGVGVAMGGGSAIASSFSGNILAWAGSLAGIAAVFGLVGFFIGRASE